MPDDVEVFKDLGRRAYRFANDFLRFATRELKIQLPWMPKVAVALCGENQWMKLLPVQCKVQTGNPQEYVKRPNLQEEWVEANAWVIRLLEKDSTTGEYLRPSQEKRLENLVDLGFPYPERLAPFDATIFVNMPNVTSAMEYGKPLAPYTVIANECVHIIETFHDRPIIKDFDAERFFETAIVVDLVDKFIESIGEKEFSRRYIPSGDRSTDP